LAPPNKKTGWPWTEETLPDIYDKNIDWPKISIVTPSFNQGRFIEETIRSVLLQNYPDLEYIIIDGGSTDNTVEIIKKYEKWITYWVSEPDKGQAHAINKGFSKCFGTIINWLNSDDYLLPDALFNIGEFNWNKGIGAVVGRGHKINMNKKRRYSPQINVLTTEAFINWHENNFMQPACFFLKEAYDSVGKLNENLYACFDVDLWIRISKKYKFEKLNKDIAHAYIQPEAKTVAQSEKVAIETFLMITTYGGFDIARKGALKQIDDLLVYRQYYEKHSGNKFYSKLLYIKNALKSIFKMIIKNENFNSCNKR
jgi:glycosyltransferase involved in cell wall biosynthesis